MLYVLYSIILLQEELFLLISCLIIQIKLLSLQGAGRPNRVVLKLYPCSPPVAVRFVVRNYQVTSILRHGESKENTLSIFLDIPGHLEQILPLKTICEKRNMRKVLSISGAPLKAGVK